MQKRSYFIISLEFYMQDFAPLEIYEDLGMRPYECKLKGKEAITLEYKEWKKALTIYQNLESLQERIASDEKDSKPHGFYKISSKVLYSDTFRKECDRYIQRLEKKHKIILKIKEQHNAFIVLKIQSFVNKKHHIALNLSSKVSKLCARLNARIVSEIQVL